MRLPGIVKRVKLAYEDRRDIFRYLYHMLSKKVYLGSYMHASYLEPERKSGMIKAFEAMIRTRQSPIAVLEVGTYGGASSILWADLLKRWGKSGFVVCNDVWRPFNTQRNRTSYIDYLLTNDRIFRLFHHNVKSAGHEDTIRTVRMNSLEFLPMIKDRSFDFVYLDGDHTYNVFTLDLADGTRLLKEGGIICGDDLTLQYSEAEVDDWQSLLGLDHAEDLASRYFHPGVTLAIWEYFGGPVSSNNGFWAMRRTESGWEDVCLAPAGQGSEG